MISEKNISYETQDGKTVETVKETFFQKTVIYTDNDLSKKNSGPLYTEWQAANNAVNAMIEQRKANGDKIGRAHV